MQATKFPKPTGRATHTIDATGIPVGRLASQCANLLIGKHRVSFAPHMDSGEHVEVRNVSQARWTGRKMEQKQYHRHSGRPGGLKSAPLGVLWEKNPVAALKHAVVRMLPKTRHRTAMFRRLKIYS